MHFLLVGPGALGCLLSFIISCGKASDDRLTLLDYNAGRADYISRNGIRYKSHNVEHIVQVNAVSAPEAVDAVDVVLLCVKSYHLLDSVEFCRTVLTERTLLIFLQNGISHLSLEAQLFNATAAYGTTTEGATLVNRGHVHHTGRGATHLGFLAPPEGRFVDLLEKTAQVLHAGGLQVEITSDIIAKLWAKLFVNVGINALSATLDCNNGELLTTLGVPARMQKAVNEAVQVAMAYNVPVPPDPWKITQTVCMNKAENIS
jgi:2-dehydropantoate 2-reductase